MLLGKRRIKKGEIRDKKREVRKDMLKETEENEISPAAYRRLVRKYQTG